MMVYNPLSKHPRLHGRSGSITHNSWRAMRRRCSDKKLDMYDHYGGRNIRVCERWSSRGVGFSNFLADMGERPSPMHSIDRIDVNGDYCPENCKWSTATEQARNKSVSRMETIDGETLCSTEWANRYGMKLTTIHGRMRKGATFEQALKRPAQPPQGMHARKG
jgi:hypothetical protein